MSILFMDFWSPVTNTRNCWEQVSLPASSGISASWMEKALHRFHWSGGVGSMSSSAWYFFLLLRSFFSLPDSFHLTVKSKEGNKHYEELTFKLPLVNTHRLQGFGEVLEAPWRQRWCFVLLPLPSSQNGVWRFSYVWVADRLPVICGEKLKGFLTPHRYYPRNGQKGLKIPWAIGSIG